MRKFYLVAIALLAGIPNLSMYYNPHMALLRQEDYDFVDFDASRGSALSAYLDGKTPYWESYNQWQCFPSADVEITCLDAEYDGLRRVPAIHILDDAHLYEFSMDPEPEPDCDKITERWKSLLENEPSFCAYAAFLQDLDVNAYDTGAKDGSVWIIRRLKTNQGYWYFESDDNWVHESEDESDNDESP